MMPNGDFVYLAGSNDIDDKREIMFDVGYIGDAVECHDVPEFMKTDELKRFLKKKVVVYPRCKKYVECRDFFLRGSKGFEDVVKEVEPVARFLDQVANVGQHIMDYMPKKYDKNELVFFN